MKKIDIGQAVAILANIGVIAGIVFLAMELRQNNELLLAQASYLQYDINRQRRLTRVEHADAFLKQASGAPLSPREVSILNLIDNDTLDGYRWQFREYQAGRLPDDFLDLRVWRDVWRSNVGLRAIFEEDRSRLEPDFVRFVDEEILNRLDEAD